MPDQREQGWTVEKRINLGDMLTMVGMMASVLCFVGFGWLHTNGRVDANEREIALNRERISYMLKQAEQDRVDIKDAIRDVREMVRGVYDRIDRKQDRN